MDQALPVAPVLFHLNPGVQIDLDPEKALHILPSKCGDLFKHSAALADDHTLMALPLAVNGSVHIQTAAVRAFFHLLNGNGNAVGNLLIH